MNSTSNGTSPFGSKANNEKQSFRQFYLKNDTNLARKGILLYMIPLAIFSYNDYAFYDFSAAFYGLSALRASLLVFSGYIYLTINKIKQYPKYDKTITATTLTLMLGCAIINLTRPENFVAQILITIISIFVLYLVVPNRFIYRCTLALIATAGQLAITTFLVHIPDTATFYTLTLTLAFANIIGILTAWQLENYRKKSYKDIQIRQQMQKKLEVYAKQLESTVEERTLELKNRERLAAIGATAAMVGHDIRNPLQAIQNNVYIAKAELDLVEENEKTGIQESLSDIEKSLEYINKIVQDLQDFAKPLNPVLKETEVEAICKEVTGELAVPSNISTYIQIEPDAKWLFVDPALLKRILTNLVNNAVQAMPNGGRLNIKAYRDQDGVVIAVEDTGMGIPDEVKQKLFTPLFTTKSKGQGFGLSVVKRMTEALDGQVTFESEVGKGTKFKVWLPTPEKA